MIIHFKRFNFLFLTVLLVAAVDLSILRWYFPPVEGWWETYAWLMASGEKLYSDIWVSFPPLQILLVRVQMALVGHDFLMLRLLGVLTHGLTVSLLYLWLERLTSRSAAFMGALLSTILVIYTNNSYIVKDYHTTVELFEVIALVFSVFIFMPKRDANPVGIRIDRVTMLGILGAGFACGSLLLVKQNIGVFFTVFMGAAIFLSAYDRYRKKGALTAASVAGTLFALAFIVPPVALTVWMGTDWLSVYFNNLSKGSLALVVMRFLLAPDCQKVLMGLIIAIILFSRNHWIEHQIKVIFKWFNIPEKFSNNISGLPYRILSFAAACYFLRLAPSQIVFSLSLFWLFSCTTHSQHVVAGNRLEWYKFGWLPLAGLAYCGTQTAGYNFVSMQLILAPMIADLVYRHGEKTLTLSRDRNIVLAGVGVVLLVIGLKLKGPLYEWWGLPQGGIMAAKYSLPFDELHGFKVDKKTADLFGELAKYKSSLTAEDNVFAYPSIPIVYMLLNKPPAVKVPVLWFDVSYQSQAETVLQDLERSKPKVIFWLKPANYVYDGHAKLRQLPSLISSVDGWLFNQIRSGQYKVENVLFLNLDSWEADSPDLRAEQPTDMFVIQPGITTNQIKMIRGVLKVDNMGSEKTGDTPLGSIIKVTFSNQYWMRKASGIFGFPYDSADHLFIVLKRKSEAEIDLSPEFRIPR